MDEHQHHGDLMEQIATEYGDILKNSDQSIYIYLDDNHKICNEKFASLLGYDSASEWSKVEKSFPDAFVSETSQEELVDAYQNAMEKFVGSMINVSWKKKSGGVIDTSVILVPVSHSGHQFALHFVS